jgi:hypothetical protein
VRAKIVADPMLHVVARFNHALMMVSQLIPFTDNSDFEEPVRIACLEDWFTNYRMLVEFLVIGVPKNCASAQSLLPGWKPQTSQEVQRLRADYGFASEQVSHIGWPKPAALEQNVAPAILQVKAGFLLDVVDEFAAALQSAGHDYADWVHLAARRARTALSGMADED